MVEAVCYHGNETSSTLSHSGVESDASAATVKIEILETKSGLTDA